jgi:hypothetical protein
VQLVEPSFISYGIRILVMPGDPRELWSLNYTESIGQRQDWKMAGKSSFSTSNHWKLFRIVLIGARSAHPTRSASSYPLSRQDLPEGGHGQKRITLHLRLPAVTRL